MAQGATVTPAAVTAKAAPGGGTINVFQRSRKSLIDDTATIMSPQSASTKQPHSLQVLAETCEWCMVEPPLCLGEDDESIKETNDNEEDSVNARKDVKDVKPPTGKAGGVKTCRKTLGLNLLAIYR